MSTCASDLNSSSARCVDEPTPDEPNRMLSGLALAAAIRSLTLLMPSSGVTTSTVGVEVMSVIGVKSFMMSKVRFGVIAALIMLAAEATNKDRKSTRLNSSHPSISYAVFCLKKKKKQKKQ